jgi:hypothetical protein
MSEFTGQSMTLDEGMFDRFRKDKQTQYQKMRDAHMRGDNSASNKAVDETVAKRKAEKESAEKQRLASQASDYKKRQREQEASEKKRQLSQPAQPKEVKHMSTEERKAAFKADREGYLKRHNESGFEFFLEGWDWLLDLE